MKNIYRQILIILLFVIITAFLTYPVMTKINSEIAGFGSDSHQVLARINDIYLKILPQSWSQKLLWLFSELTTLRFDFFDLVVCFSLIFKNIVTGYNLFWLLSFILAAYGAYLLANLLVKNHWAAFLAGIIYSFSSVHFVYSYGFFGSTHIEWIPFFLYFLFNFLKNPKFINWFGSFLFFLFIVKGEHHYTAFILLFLLFLIGYVVIYKRPLIKELIKKREFKIYFGFGVILVFLIIIWAFYSLIKVSLSANNYLNPGIDQVVAYSSDLLGFIIPAFTNQLYGQYFNDIRQHFTGNIIEKTNYLGTLLLILFVIFYFLTRQQRKRNYDFRFWFFIFIVFAVLSLGPFLHFLGVGEPYLPLPYLIIYKFIPFINNIRAIGRLNVITFLGLAISFAYLIDFIFKKYQVKKKFLITLSISMIIMIEFFALPIPTFSLGVSDFYQQLRYQPGNFKILQIPGSTSYRFASRTLYYKSIHQKQKIDGLDFARQIKDSRVFQNETPVISELLYDLPTGDYQSFDIIKHDYKNLSNNILNYNQIKYIILAKEFLEDKEETMRISDWRNSLSFIKENITKDIYYNDQQITVFQVPELKENKFCYLSLGNGWGDKYQSQDGDYLRLLKKGQGTIKIVNNFQPELDLQLKIKLNFSEAVQGIINIQYQQQLIQYLLSEESREINFVLFALPLGESQLEIKVTNLQKKTKAWPVEFRKIEYSTEIPTFNDQRPIEFLSNSTNEKDKILVIPDLYGHYFTSESIFNQLDFKQRLLNDIKIIQAEKDQENKLISCWFKYPFSETEPASCRDIAKRNYYQQLINQTFIEQGIDFILFDKQINEAEVNKSTESFLDNFFFSTKEDQYYKLYQTKSVANVPIFSLNENLSALENIAHSQQVKKARSGATIKIKKTANFFSAVKVSMFIYSCPTVIRKINFVMANKVIYQHLILPGERKVVEFNISLEILALEGDLELIALDEFGQPLTNEEYQSCPLWVTDLELSYLVD